MARLAVVVIALGIGACDRRPADKPDSNRRKLIVCTTTMIADLAAQIGGEHIQVVGIIRPGVDPHIYDPTPDDSIWFRKADLVLVNGLHLEGRMLNMIEAVGSKVLRLGEHPDISRRQSAASAAPDPHVWWDVRYFKIFAEQTRDAFQSVDPVHKDAYEQRAQAYITRLDKLDAGVRESILTIPESARYMITSHDAFYYFGEAYGLQVDAVLGISTDAQAKADEPERLARIASQRRLPAMFHETSVSAAQNQLVDRIRQLAAEKHNHQLRIAGPLYSDSLGVAGSGADSYVGAVEANTRMIVEALGGTDKLTKTEEPQGAR